MMKPPHTFNEWTAVPQKRQTTTRSWWTTAAAPDQREAFIEAARVRAIEQRVHHTTAYRELCDEKPRRK